MARVALSRLGFALVGFTIMACGGGDDGTSDTGTSTPRDSGPVVEPDAGDEPPDAGTPDTGPRDCSPNPFRCAPMQEMDEDCVCLESCVGGLRWNPATGMCEMPPQGECNTADDCNPGQACLNAPQTGGIGTCNGEATCRCLTECDPWVRFPQSGCPPTQDFGGGSVPVACTWLGDESLPDALCLPEGAGGGQSAACVDAMACNRNKNFFCTGRTANQNTGACARLCDVDRPDEVCTELGDYACVGLGDEMRPELGFCATAPALDIGTTCTSTATCDAQVCSAILSGSCTQTCGGLSLCPPEALCISFTGGAPPGEEDICMLRCASPDATGDDECRALNPATICRALLTMGPPLCSPPCTMGLGCQMPMMCDPGSGRCM